MEPDLGGLGRFGNISVPGRKAERYGEIRSDKSEGFKIAGIDAARSALKALSGVIDGLSTSWGKSTKQTEAHTKAIRDNTKAINENQAAAKRAGGGMALGSGSGSTWGGSNNRASSASASAVASGAYLGGSGGAPGAPAYSGGYGGPPPPPTGGGGGGSFSPGGGTPSAPFVDTDPSGGAMGGIPVLGMVTKALDLIGSITKAGAQYGYNRIEGPTGNRNAMLQLSQSLGPVATMAGLDVNTYIKGLAQRTPVMGNMSDIVGTIAAGQNVGAQLLGTPERNGFFAAVRQMQTLAPGVAAPQLANSLGNYMSNIGSQQRGAFYGGGAFTMMGQGGRFKSLGEWANQISKFLEEKRPGDKRGVPFTKEELIAQNFPGSNINAWFQFMGVPEDMQDMWWQYAMTKVRAGSSGSFDLNEAVGKQRGTDLAHERLRNVTQSARRDFALGNAMYPLYAAREGADRRFNQAMGGADMMLAQMSRGTNVGTMLATLPTPIVEMLMPVLLKLISSPVGTAAAGFGIVNELIGDPGGPIGDPGGPIGDYGKYGGSSTSGLAPDLAKRVQAMQRANPNVKVTSGHRDSFLQRRLQKMGVGQVGPASRSAHTRGWAADLGPTSQIGWIAANAHKFGLQVDKYEPWHAQVAGTMSIGDPTPIGEEHGNHGIFGTLTGLVTDPMGTVADAAGGMASDALGGIVKAIMGPLIDAITSLGSGFMGIMGSAEVRAFKGLANKFLTGGTPLKMVDNATQFFTKLTMGPLSGLMNLFGKADNKPSDYQELIDTNSTINLALPKFDGFSPSTSAGGPDIFGDPYMGMRPGGGGSGVNVTSSPVVFHNTFQISGVGGSPQEARQFASAIAGHLESEMSSRGLRSA